MISDGAADGPRGFGTLLVPATGRAHGRQAKKRWLMPAPDRSRALDHIVVVLFENRSLDNVLGHLYEPGDGKDFDGVIGKNLSNPIPAWARTRQRHQTRRPARRSPGRHPA